MKPVDSLRTSPAYTAVLVLPLLMFAASSTGCSSPSPREFTDVAPRSEVGTRDASYSVATTPEDLKRLVAEDLELGDSNQIYSGLEAFVGENVVRGTAKRAHLMWESVKPTTMLQYGRGRDVMGSVKQLGDLLGNEGTKEMETAFETLRQGDFEQVQRLRDEPMGIFHPSTAAMSREVRPYALLADGVLSYRDVAANQEASPADVQVALDKLSMAQTELAKIGETKGMFLADAAAAQSLERAGQVDAAAEYWMRIAESDEYLKQPEVMRNLVAARIKTYSVRMKERLIVEVEEERRQELRARDAQYSAQVVQLEEKHQGFDKWARAGFMSAAKRMAALSTEDDTQKAQLASLAQVAEERDAELARATDDMARRVGSLDRRSEELAERAAELEGRATALDERVAKAKDELQGEIDEVAGSLKTGQDALDARAEGLERRTDELAEAAKGNADKLGELAEAGTELGERTGTLEVTTRELAEAGEGTAKRVTELDERANAIRADLGMTAAESQEAAKRIERSDAELAQALRDLASYREAVDSLTADASLSAMTSLLDEAAFPAEGEGADVATAAPRSLGGGVMSLPAYLAVHSVQDVFGVDGHMQQLTAFFVPED